MSTKNIQCRNADVVYIHDPVSFDHLWIDKIREARIEDSKLFDIINLLEDQALILGSSKIKVKALIQLARLEYGDGSDVIFNKRNLEPLRVLLKCLPQLKIKAIGINLHSSLEADGIASPGEFIRDTFIKNTKDIQRKLNKPIFASSVRLFYGEIMDYYDLRMYPRNLTDNVISITLHKHRDIDVAEQERLMEITNEMFFQACEENDKVSETYGGG